MPSVAVLIVARNAASTIECALRSALYEPIDELVLLDDQSKDGTVAIAKSILDPRLKIVSIDEHRTLGYARSRSLESITAEYCFLLDADDAILPGRVNRLMKVFSHESVDFVADEIELVDGKSGALLRNMRIPGFLDTGLGLLRLFERNYLPGIGQIGFRVETMRRVGYDVLAHGTEDTDLVLRALVSGAKGVLVREIGYRMRHFPNSVSRDRDRQSSELAKVLQKHKLADVRKLLISTGLSDQVIRWALFSLALFQQDYVEAQFILAEILDNTMDSDLVLEPDGPCSLPESWRLAFAEGSLALLRNDEINRAVLRLQVAVEIAAEPEALNNLGVALWRAGSPLEAKTCFERALALIPGYADARDNVSEGCIIPRVTSHPFRRNSTRSEY